MFYLCPEQHFKSVKYSFYLPFGIFSLNFVSGSSTSKSPDRSMMIVIYNEFGLVPTLWTWGYI